MYKKVYLLYLNENTRGDHKYVIQGHQVSHCQGNRVEGCGEEATAGGGHVHHQHHTDGSHAEGIKCGPQTRQPIADYDEQERLYYHSRKLEVNK